MTDNTQEIDVILEDFYDGDIRQSDMGKAKQAILNWHNKQVEAVLDRLLNGTTTIYLDTEPNNPVKSNIEPLLFKAEIKAAIRAERNKLKGSK